MSDSTTNVSMGAIPQQEDEEVKFTPTEVSAPEEEEAQEEEVESPATDEVIGEGSPLYEDTGPSPFPDDNDPDSPLYGDGPTKSQIDEWKKHYGTVIVSTFPGEQYMVWRPLNRSEYRALSQELENMMASGEMSQTDARLVNEEQTVEVASLYPKYIRGQNDDELGGIASLVAQQVMEASGFVALEVQAL